MLESDRRVQNPPKVQKENSSPAGERRKGIKEKKAFELGPEREVGFDSQTGGSSGVTKNEPQAQWQALSPWNDKSLRGTFQSCHGQ